MGSETAPRPRDDKGRYLPTGKAPKVRKAPADMAGAWEGIVHTLLETGAVWRYKTEVAPQVWSIKPSIGWPAVGREIASAIPGGVIFPAQGRATWRCGSLYGGTVLDSDTVESLLEMRRIVASVRGWEGMEGCWSHGKGARLLWAWVGRAAPYSRNRGLAHADRHLYPSVETDDEGHPIYPDYAYHECYPGVYDQTEAALFDVKSAYYTILGHVARNPDLSLRPTVKAGAISWGHWRGSERERMRDMLEAVADHRELRQAIWGASIGSFGTIATLMPDGEGGAIRGKIASGPGPFRALGLIVSATMRDLIHAQAAAGGSVYANVDSVLFPDRTRPLSVLEDHGLRVGTKHAGHCEVRRRTSWGFWTAGQPRPDDWQGDPAPGDPWIWRTKPYRSSAAVACVPRPPLPVCPVYSQWLS